MNQKLLSRILIALALITIVIGVVQTVRESDIAGNYWIFMVAFVFYLLYHYKKKSGRA